MVEVETKVGPKGQILIPKLLREEYNIMPGDDIIVRETEEGLLIEKPMEDPVKVLEEISNKGKKITKINYHQYEDQIDERWRKSRK